MISQAAAAAVPLPESPFRGIAPFRFVDQDIFFAREKETKKLLDLITVYRGVLLYGGSGSGKSSMINAGLIPAALEEGFVCDRVRVQPRHNQEFIVERISKSVAGDSLFLPSNLGEDTVADSPPLRFLLSVAEFKSRLKGAAERQLPLLIFDQFEEFISLFEEAPRGETLNESLRTQKVILRVIVEILRDHTLPVKLLFVFREDYLAKLDKLFLLSPDLSDQYQRLTPPDIDALYDIIRGSFEKFPGRFGNELPPALAKDVTNAFKQRSASDPLNLSEVQIVCLKLWKDDNPEELFKKRGIEGLLQDYQSEAIKRLPEQLLDPAISLLSRMITSSGTRNVISEDDLIIEIEETEGIPAELLRKALAALVVETRLVIAESRFNTYFYSIASEFLVPWITQQKAERMAEISSQIERRKRRTANRVAALSIALALVVSVAAFIVIRVRTQAAIAEDKVMRAEMEAAQAVKERQEEESRRTSAEHEMVNVRSNLESLSQLQNQANQTIADLNQQVADLKSRLSAATRERNKLRNMLGDIQGDPSAESLRMLYLTEKQRNATLQQELKNCRESQ
jgi:hypothetical protein